MKALILNSGIGKRMGELTKECPKCLVEIDEHHETILGHQLKHLQKLGINDIIITTGPFKEKIEQYIQQHFSKINVRYVHNNIYDSTNYIYSMYLTKDKILEDEEEIILMHGDLVFEEEVLKLLTQHREKNTALLDRSVPLPEKDFKGRVKNNLVTEISINTFGDNCYFLAPLYKFSSLSFRLWLQEIEKFVQKNDTKVYAENALNLIFHQIPLSPLFCDGLFCMEIDNLQDLEIAKEKLKTIAQTNI